MIPPSQLHNSSSEDLDNLMKTLEHCHSRVCVTLLALVFFADTGAEDAWTLHRGDLIRTLQRRVPSRNIHLGKQLRKYSRGDTNSPLTLEFSDGTHASCDVLIGCDGIRSVTRGQMMRQEAERTRKRDFLRYIDPRWSGTITYRSLVPSARLAARNPNHSLLTGGQIVSDSCHH